MHTFGYWEEVASIGIILLVPYSMFLMSPESENPLQDQLRAEIDNSQWLQKFREIGDNLKLLKVAIPATQLCQLKWNTGNNGLDIYCPNEETWNYLTLEIATIAKLPLKCDRVTLFWQDQNLSCKLTST